MTHQELAVELKTMLETSNLQIPTQKARQFVEICDWVDSIADGTLKVVPKGPVPRAVDS